MCRARRSLDRAGWQAKVKEWQRKLGTMAAYAKVDEDQATQLKFDLERAYNDFKQLIRHRRPQGA